MCGIVGGLNLTNETPMEAAWLRQMLGLIRHRGPDGFGIYLDAQVGLGSARLSIIDLAGGDQPICNEDGRLWIVFNGEIFNYRELRRDLEGRGHIFSTQTDTEVILHLYEEVGTECVRQLNGQFCFAIWDTERQSLFLGRDRLGIRPLFYSLQNGRLIFASEIKSILAFPGVQAELDPTGIDQVFQYWSPLGPGTVFKGIYDLPPGHTLLIHNGDLLLNAYWSLDFGVEPAAQASLPQASLPQASLPQASLFQALDELEALLIDATQIRLRADVPVGAYLSGGLDSAIIAAVIRNYSSTPLDTFSIAFSDPEFDESSHQKRMAEFLGTHHQTVSVRQADIGQIFPQVIWHTETPILRTAPAPMYLLSQLVNQHGYKVVLTGEGADEFLAGYDIFKEARIRRFWASQPQSTARPRLFTRIYPDISALPENSAYLASFFGNGLADTESPFYSHANRWRNTSRTKRFFSTGLKQAIQDAQFEARGLPALPDRFFDWPPLGQAQYLEASIFLPQYLLSSQGDRMAMAHSVEGRFPFLDYRLVEFCNRLPPGLKLLGLMEKYILKKLARKWLPEATWRRVKRPYRAPIHRCFFQDGAPDYVCELLSEPRLLEAGLFDPQAVGQLVRKIESGKRLGETDDMALAGILSSQLVHQQFVRDFRPPQPVRPDELNRVILPGQTDPRINLKMGGD